LLVGLPEKELTSENSVCLYPNPMTDRCRVYVNGQQSITAFQLFNAVGKCVRSGVLEKDDPVIHFGEFPKGLYFLQLKADGKQYPLTKLVIQ
jgi:hypothetical protein